MVLKFILSQMRHVFIDGKKDLFFLFTHSSRLLFPWAHVEY